MNLDNDDIKLRALEKSHYNPEYKKDQKDNFIESFEINEFDVEELKNLAKNSVSLMSHSQNYRLLIIEILDILAKNKYDFLIAGQNYITFYWSGIPVLEIIINKDTEHGKQLHISLQRYKEIKGELISDKKTNRILLSGVGLSLALSVGAFAIALYKSYE